MKREINSNASGRPPPRGRDRGNHSLGFRVLALPPPTPDGVDQTGSTETQESEGERLRVRPYLAAATDAPAGRCGGVGDRPILSKGGCPKNEAGEEGVRDEMAARLHNAHGITSQNMLSIPVANAVPTVLATLPGAGRKLYTGIPGSLQATGTSLKPLCASVLGVIRRMSPWQRG